MSLYGGLKAKDIYTKKGLKLKTFIKGYEITVKYNGSGIYFCN